MGKKRRHDGFHQPFAGLSLPVAPAQPSSPPKRSSPPAARSSSSEDDLFLTEMAGTKPLVDRGARVGGPEPLPKKRAAPSDDAEVLATLADLCDGAGSFDIADSDEYIEGRADGIDKRLLKKLRAGDYSVEAHVDLHGLSQTLAREKVASFLALSRRESRRCVLIVHGRGHHSKDQIPVLKQSLKVWLERGSIARSVLAFATARPCDGGAGAVYVLLRR
jgi:DNA-nicking Smr family endonuclease